MNNNTKRDAGLGVAAVLAAAAAAGAYWFYGSEDAAKHRRQIKSFMLKARGDVLAAVEKTKEIDKEKYLKIVDRVVARYSGLAGITATEIAEMARDLRAAWGHMQTAHTTIQKAAPKKATRKPAAKKKSASKKKS